MSFGKKSGEAPSTARPRLAAPASAPAQAASPKSSSATASGGLDGRFLALALGVAVVAGGAAFAAPSVFSWGNVVVAAEAERPLPQVMAGLSHDQARKALATQAFPDKAGREFMTALAAEFPEDHEKLLGVLADAALAGADREGLTQAAVLWTLGFVQDHGDAIGRSGVAGFNAFLDMGDEALDLVKDINHGRCDLGSLRTASRDPARLQNMAAYDSKAYRFAMRAGRHLVSLAAAGRKAPPLSVVARPEDEAAMQQAMLSMMSDPAVMRIIQTMSSSSGRMNDGRALDAIDACGLGHRLIAQLQRLPDGTKARIWALAVQQLRFTGRSSLAELQRFPGFGAP